MNWRDELISETVVVNKEEKYTFSKIKQYSIFKSDQHHVYIFRVHSQSILSWDRNMSFISGIRDSALNFGCKLPELDSAHRR